MKLAESGPEEARPESVTEFTRRVKELLEGGIGSVWVRGEISNLRVQASGHAYFSLKDSGAQLKAVLFRGNAARQTVRLRDGLQVVVFGEASVYEARGEYQLIVRVVVDDGVGRLQREFEALKARLAAEGLSSRRARRRCPRCRGWSVSSHRPPGPPCRISSASSPAAAGAEGWWCCRPRSRARVRPRRSPT